MRDALCFNPNNDPIKPPLTGASSPDNGDLVSFRGVHGGAYSTVLPTLAHASRGRYRV